MTADFETLVRQNGARIRRIALRYAAPGEAEDLIQDILLALLQNYGGFRGEARLETWLYRVALNTAISGVRKKVSRRQRDERFHGLYRETSAPASLPEKDILGDFLASLGEVDASIMMMTLDGMSPADIEDVIGTSANAIAVRINRIKQKYIAAYIE